MPSVPAHRDPALVLLVGVGGAAGTLARWATGVALPAADGWPVGTLTVNVAGAFVLGLLLEGLLRRGPETPARRRRRLLLGTGFCGGFTTYSSFAVELDRLLAAGHGLQAAGYAVVTVLVGLLAATAGVSSAARHHRWRRGRGGVDPDVP